MKDAQSEFVGHMLRSPIESDFLNHYSVRPVGDVAHREYRIPAADLTAFNESIEGKIEMVAEYRGETRAPAPPSECYFGCDSGASFAFVALR